MTYLKTNASRKNWLPIAAGFLFLPSLVFAQSEQQLLKIKQASNLKQLNILEKGLRKSTLNLKELKTKAHRLNLPFSGTIEDKSYQLQGFTRAGLPLYYVTFNRGAAKGSGASKLHSTGGYFQLDGQGMKVHEWDGGGVLTTHQEFGNRVVQKDTPSQLSNHATHVAGTMVAEGINPNVKGMAPKATLDAYDWDNDASEMTDAAANGAILSNHSYGYPGGFEWGNWSGKNGWHWLGLDSQTEYIGFGQYNEEDRTRDLVAVNAPYYLPVEAAGNSRGGGPKPGGVHYVYNPSTKKWSSSYKKRSINGGADGFDCINFSSTGKNVLVVGAAEKINGDYQDPSDVKMASFSAFGPVDDGRIKPDITGIGVDISSTNSTGNDAYTTMSGTSMASPNVTGTLVLLQEHYAKLNSNNTMKAATLKALVINTAHEAGSAIGPDYKSGWGLINAFGAAKAISLKDKYTLIEEKSLQNGQAETVTVTASGTEPLKATIAWTDPVPTTLSNENTLNDRTKMLVNDLDIRIFKDNTEVGLPWKLDPEHPANAATRGDNDVDNVEQILIENPDAGATYTIKVTHKGTLKKNEVQSSGSGNTITLVDTDKQDFSLVVSGITNGITQDLEATSAKIMVSPSEYSNSTPVEFIITNKGTDTFTNAKLKVKLVNKDDNNAIEYEQLISLPNINSGSSETITHHFNLSKSFTHYNIVAEIESSEDQESINNKVDTNAFGVVSDLTPDQSISEFGFEDDFNTYGWTVEDTDNNGSTWLKYDDLRIANTGNSFAINIPNGKMNINDWLFSNPIKLKANTNYRVVFFAKKFRPIPEAIGVYFGAAANSGAMTNTVAPKVEADADGKYHRYVYEFSVTTDQTVYFGFNHKVTGKNVAYALALDDVRFEYAVTKPDPIFTANKLTTNSYEVIEFQNQTDAPASHPVTNWEWTFSPNTVTFKDGTNANSETPKVTFQHNGKYSVTLKATNDLGVRSTTKSDYIDVLNVDTEANFKSSSTSIYEGEAVVLTNTSTGYPAPEQFLWTITPSEGVEFISGDATTENPNIKFNKSGKYTVQLKAKSKHNENVMTKDNYINVASYHAKVDDLAHSFNTSNKLLTLSWKRPDLNPSYVEGFENSGNFPADITDIDANNDNYKWFITKYQRNSGEYAAMNYSYPYATSGIDVDDYLVTSKLRGGAELLKFAYKNDYPERFDVYVVEAPNDGSVPTPDQIKAGHKVYTNELAPIQIQYTTLTHSIKDFTNKDFFIAFHHRTRKADAGFALMLDDIEVGYDNSISGKSGAKSETPEIKDLKSQLFESSEQLTTLYSDHQKSLNTVTHQPINFGATNLPYLVGYEVVKDGTSVKNIQDIKEKVYNENINQNGVYVYDVYALYSDGLKSEKSTVTVDISTLATTDISKDNGIKVYPNPSNGLFVVEADKSVNSIHAEVYDGSGKQVFSRTFKKHTFELNLTQYPKGVYILNLVDQKGTKHSIKLMIK